MTDKKPKPSSIEDVIGERAKTPEPTPSTLRDVPDQPLTQNEMLDLEELNRRTAERLQDKPEEEIPSSVPQEQMTTIPITTTTGKKAEVPQVKYDPIPQQATIATPKSPIPVSKPVLPPQEVKTCSQESPPQTTDYWCPTCKIDLLDENSLIAHVCPTPKDKNAIGELDALVKEEIPDVGGVMDDVETPTNIPLMILPEQSKEEIQTQKEICGEIKDLMKNNTSAEDIELTALRKYILEDGFVLATVAFHIVSLCTQPMTTPSTTMWDFRDRAMIPDMVLALLNQPGYLEGIWPSLKIVMADNKGNSAWCAGIATTIAFFDVIRTLPTLKELQKENVD